MARTGALIIHLGSLNRAYFGENTTIAYKFHFGPEYKLDAETPLCVQLERENFQRQQFLELWLANGMAADDIGFLGDIDEVWTRDAFRAMQVGLPLSIPGLTCSG